MNLNCLRDLGLACAVVAVMGWTTTQAASISFTGQFSADDDVQFVTFEVGAVPSVVTLKMLSYAGGTNADGTLIPEGGFDPFLTVFDSNGLVIAFNDDGSSFDVPASSVTGNRYDSFLALSGLLPGTYVASVTQYLNSPITSNLSGGFSKTGQHNYTSTGGGCSQFCSGAYTRTNGWALDILNVESASVVPAPPAVWLLATGLAGLGGRRWLRRKATV